MTSRSTQQHRRFALVISVAIVLLSGSRRATAQRAESEALFDEATRLMAQGQIAKACDAFEAANQAQPSAGTLIGLGVCREKNQQLASAWSAYKEALSRVKDVRKREFATARITDLQPRLSYLTVSISDENHLDGLTLTRNGKPFDPLLWNRALPIDGGDYVIVGHAPGREDWTTTAHVAVEGARITIDVPKLHEPSKSPLPVPLPTPVVLMPAAQVSTPHLDPDAARPIALFTTRRKVAIGLAGASVIGVVAGVVLGESAKGKQHDAYGLCPDPATPCAQADRADALIQSRNSRALEANVAFGIAVVAAVGAGLLWFTGAPVAQDAAPRVSVVPSLAPDAAGIVVMGRL